MSIISLEAMQAVLQSKFGKELDAIWQEIIDYRDKELREMTYRGRYQAIRKFFQQTTAKKFQACVWKNVGLHIDEVTATSLYTGSFCTWIFFDNEGKDDQKGTFQIESILNGDYIQKCFPIMAAYIDKQHFSTEELMKIASSYDSTKGVIRESMKMEMRKFLNCHIGFDVELGFLAEDQLAKGSGVSNFTAQEITAIILHEIGHNLTLVEHAADAFARISTFRYMEAAFKQVNSENIDEVVKLANTVASVMDKKGDKANASKLVGIANQLKKDISTAGSSAQNHMIRQTIGGFIETVFGFVNDIFCVPLTMIFGNLQMNRFGMAQKNKISDIPLNGRLVTWQERKADEYAFTHGYGAEQVSALRKLGAFFDRFGLSERAVANLNAAERLHKDIGFFAKCHLLVLAPLYAGDYSYSLYPAGAKRFRELLNLTIQQLKAHCTDPSYIAKYMKDAEYILSQIDSNSSRDEYIAKLYRGYDLFMRYCSLPSFIDWLVHGRVKREIEDLINDADKIGNSLLTFYGHKIQQLATK